MIKNIFPPSFRQSMLLGTAIAFSCLAYAFFSEYVQGYQPCPMCWFQRVAMLISGILLLLLTVLNPKTQQKQYIVLLLPIISVAIGGALAARHVWMQLHPNELANCSDLVYMMDILPFFEVIKTVVQGDISCGKIDWVFLGLSMPTWVLLIFILLFFICIFAPMFAKQKQKALGHF